MKDRRSGFDRRKNNTDVIPEESIRESMATLEFKAVPVLPTELTVETGEEVARFIIEEAERLNLNTEKTAALIFAQGIRMIQQVRKWREKTPLLNAKEKDSYYANASPYDYRRDG